MAANIIAGIALLVSIGALVVSWVYGHKSADSSARSARAAEDSAADARRVRKAELEREHRDYAPKLENLEFVWEKHPTRDRQNHFMTFKLPNTYRVFGDRIDVNQAGSSRTPLVGLTGGAVEGGVTCRIPLGDNVNPPQSFELRLFPPFDGDPGEKWSCPCDRDSVGDSATKAGHWVIHEDVPPQPKARVRFV